MLTSARCSFCSLLIVAGQNDNALCCFLQRCLAASCCCCSGWLRRWLAGRCRGSWGHWLLLRLCCRQRSAELKPFRVRLLVPLLLKGVEKRS